jgi:hypothetical protein
MFTTLRALLTKWFQRPPAQRSTPHPPPEDIPEFLKAHQEAPPLEPCALNRDTASLVPYDENLLERARTQWQFGDWESLSNLDRDTLQHHPDRAKLALLAAAGRLQNSNVSEAKQFIRLAQDWGVSKKLVSQILIAGVHNNLGRAAAVAENQTRALKHFESAIIIGTPGSDTCLLAQARIGEQLCQLGLPDRTGLLKYGSGEAVVIHKLPMLAKNIDQQNKDIEAQFKKQADEFIRFRKNINANLKTEVANAARQIGDFISLQNYFGTGKISEINLEINGWAVSSDFMLYLVKLIHLNEYDLIIEFGSGHSTLVIAKVLSNLAPRRQDKLPVCFISFDHLDEYYRQTRKQLEHAGLADSVLLIHAPLAEYTAPSGCNYLYYSCQTALSELVNKYPTNNLRILVSIDGPPGNSCKHARYPALPLILSYFQGASIDFLLDDAARTEEKEVIKLWLNEITAAELRATEQIINLEKGASLIHVEGTATQ